MSQVEHIKGTTFHGRKGETQNAFRYSVDYVLLDAERAPRAPWLFGRNRRNVVSLMDRDHGGAPGAGRGAAWVREVLSGLPVEVNRIELLAQPRVLGHVFNPVAFWLVYDHADALRVVIAEVTNTYRDRHSYLCHRDDFRATLTGKRVALTNAGLLSAFLRRPFGSRRVLGLIHWQALKLWWKGVAFRSRPEPPEAEVSR